MTEAIVVGGALKDARTVILDDPLPVDSGRVEVSVRLSRDAALPKQSLGEFLRDLRARQVERGHVPMTAEEIDAHIRAERDAWGD